MQDQTDASICKIFFVKNEVKYFLVEIRIVKPTLHYNNIARNDIKKCLTIIHINFHKSQYSKYMW